jgi:hypothetical protein
MMRNLLGWIKAIPLAIGMVLGPAAPFVFAALAVSFVAGAIIF